MRKIDIFTHIYPARLLRQADAGRAATSRTSANACAACRCSYDLDERFRVMDRFEDYQQVLSLPTPPIEVDGGPRPGDRARARRQRRHGGAGRRAIRSASPAFVASLPFNDPDAAVQRGAPRRRRARRARHPDLLERPRQADLGRRVPAALRDDGRLRSADLAAPVSRRRHPRLPDRGSDRSSRSGGRSAGRTRPAWRWRASCSRASSIGSRT